MTTGKVDPNKLYVPGQALGKPAAAPTPAAIGETAPSGDERLPSPVPPGQLDPEAVKYIKKAVDVGASDVHLPAGSPPFMRLNGEITFFDAPPLSEEQALRMALGFMDDAQQQRFLRHHDLDLSYEHPELGRFRVNALLTFRGADIIFRIIPKGVPTLKSLGIPESIGGLTEWTQGLVLVTGPAGCGKSTTAAALVDMVNANRHDHVITVEDPVEFIHPSKNCNVTQRQVPRDTASFATALRGALREDPDVIMIGEMRDLETISLALTAAETGHLVIGTLHTKSAARTVDRIIDVFPTDQQAQIRIMISEALRGIVSQVLIPRANGKGRVAALEVLYNNTAVANAVRDAKSFQIPSIMQTGKKLGMKLMDDSLAELVTQGVIKREEAIKYAENPKHIPG
ncbi:MAG: PilT/PilU family type 4a pilus ATPase [Planctomycetes bacterium]|nr:PilT/PilU family type 4a pilus ATPase [Planctomycetota bacterium]